MRILLLSALSSPLCFWLDFSGTLLAGAAVAMLAIGMKKAFNEKYRAAVWYSGGAVIVFLFAFCLIMLSRYYQ